MATTDFDKGMTEKIEACNNVGFWQPKKSKLVATKMGLRIVATTMECDGGPMRVVKGEKRRKIGSFT